MESLNDRNLPPESLALSRSPMPGRPPCLRDRNRLHSSTTPCSIKSRTMVETVVRDKPVKREMSA